MKLDEDYILRMIREIAQALAKVITGKSEINYELPAEEDDYTSLDLLYKEVIRLSDQGEINEAENFLLDAAEEKDSRFFELALAFYMHLDEFSDEFLETHQYSREEIAQGIESLSEDYGISGLMLS